MYLNADSFDIFPLDSVIWARILLYKDYGWQAAEPGTVYSSLHLPVNDEY